LKKRAEWKKRGQQYYERHRQHLRDVITRRREARNAGNFYVPPEAKVAFVIRLKG
jgi:large subunit ribosomal protein L7e